MQCNSSPEYHAITTAEGGNYCLVEKYSTDMLGNFPGSGPISKIKTRKKYDLFFKQNSITVHPLQTFVIQIIIFFILICCTHSGMWIPSIAIEMDS